MIAIIPARGGSKGLLRKNVRILGGKPLIQWTVEAASKSRYISQIILSTEDDKIADIFTDIAKLIKKEYDKGNIIQGTKGFKISKKYTKQRKKQSKCCLN